MENNIQNHLRALVQLSIIDRDFGEPEKTYVYTIGKANRLTKEEIDALVADVLTQKESYEINYEGLLTEERFDYLYDIIQCMKIDGEVYLTEIKYCEQMAERLGYDKKVVKVMSSRVYKDPSITVNRQSLMDQANKYLK
ncbi:MAG: TerB family tellurite resistance protein [Bacteroidota bacterium]